MRKLKLLLMAFALFGGVSLGWAQTDVTNTYITNADFSSTEGWTVSQGGGSTYNMGNGLIGDYKPTGSVAAMVDDNHQNNEYCLGFSCRWNGVYAAYQQETQTLPAGHYVLSYDVEDVNGSSTKISYNNLFYVQVGETKYADGSTEWMDAGASAWTVHTISFDIEESSKATISLGYGNNENKNTTPTLYVSHLKLTWIDPALAAAQTKLSGYIKKATALNGVLSDASLGNAVTSAKGVLESATNSEAVNTESTNLSSAITTALSGLTPVALTNANFDTDVNIAADGSTDVSFIEPATEAKPYIYPVSGWTPNFTFSSTASQGTTAAYGATITGDKGNNGTNPPATDMFGNADGGALHLSSGWSDQARYKQVLENLSSGRYLFYYEANNQNSGATTINSNYFGVSGEAGDFYGTTNSFSYSDNKSFAFNEWTASAFEFDVAKTTNITFHVGVVGTTGGSASGAKLWIDNVLVYRIADVMVTDEDANKIIEDAEALNDVAYNAAKKSDLTSKLSAFKGNKSLDNYNTLNAALATAKSSVNAYKKLDAAIKNTETWTTTTAAEALRAKYNNGNYEDETTAADIYEEYQAAEIAALAGSSAIDWTSVILNASFETGDMTGWSAESRSDTGVKDQSNNTYSITKGDAVDGLKLFNSWGGSAENNVYQTIKNLPAGTYTLTALVAGFKDETLTVAAGEKSNDVVVAGDKTVGYTVAVTFTIATAGDVLIKASNTKGAEGSDASFIKADNFKFYKGNVMTNDYTNLNSAIEQAESKVLGFAKDEYAPYNNVEALEALAAAKAVDQEKENVKITIDGLTETLNDATWTQNETDVDIVYNGHFAEAAGWNPKGWSRSNGAWGQQVTGLDSSTGAEAGTAWYYNSEGAWEYGKAGVYTMPLPANTAYTLMFKYRSHAWESNNWMKASVLKGDEGLSDAEFPRNISHENFMTAVKNFKTGSAGNYVLSIYNSGNTHVTDVSIVPAISESVTVSDAGYATYVSDIDLDFSETNIKAYTAKVEGGKIVLTKIDKVAAGTPVVLYCEGGKTESIPVLTGTADDATGNQLVRGTGAEIATEGEGVTNYILNNVDNKIGFYKANNQKVAKNRAYLPVSGGSDGARLTIVFADATGVSDVRSKMSDISEEIYNLNGQRVVNAKKGLYIIGGKKKVIK